MGYKRILWPPFQTQFSEVFVPEMPIFLAIQLKPFLNKDRQEDIWTLAETHECVIMETQQKLERNNQLAWD